MLAQDREQRRANVEGSFECPEDVSGASIILIDDVATTGSTLSACAAALKAAGGENGVGVHPGARVVITQRPGRIDKV